MHNHTYLTCKIGPGVFKSERSFTLKVEDKTFSGLVDQTDTTSLNQLRVRVLETRLKETLIEFPRESIMGSRTWVPNKLLSKHVRPAR